MFAGMSSIMMLSVQDEDSDFCFEGWLGGKAVNSNDVGEYMSELYSAACFDWYTEKIRRSDDGKM